MAKCYSVAFEKSGAVSDAKITPHTLNFVKKLVSTFGVGLENVSNVSTMFSSAASESLARRAQATAQDPVFQKLKGQFTTGNGFYFYFSIILISREISLTKFSCESILLFLKKYHHYYSIFLRENIENSTFLSFSITWDSSSICGAIKMIQIKPDHNIGNEVIVT